MDLIVNCFKETHQSFDLIGHEILIVFNVLHFALLIYYFLFELLSRLLSLLFNYPPLPVLVYFDNYFRDSRISAWLTLIIKVILILGALSGLIGSANWKISSTLISTIFCSPFVTYDIVLLIGGRFHHIDVEKFLLFQTLFVSTIRSLRILATVSNIAMIIHMAFNLPIGVTFGNFL